MSKIYKALERAEEERRARQELSPISVMVDRTVAGESIATAPVPMGDISAGKPLVSLVQPGSLVAEQFRKLRTYLLRLNATEQLKTILVTSAAKGEGKSFVSANLAIGISNDLHTHALLVDCDLRSPALSRWFGVTKGKGLSDYLNQEAELPEIIVETGVDKLSLIPAGKVENRPGDFMGGNRMRALVQELKSRYADRITIFDSTPLLATTEPEILAKVADGILFVIGAGVTKREPVVRALNSLEKEKIVGVVLNGLTLKSSAMHSRYFGSDGYYYKYGYGREKSNSGSRWKKIFGRENRKVSGRK